MFHLPLDYFRGAEKIIFGRKQKNDLWFEREGATVKERLSSEEERFTKIAGKNWLDPYVHTGRDHVEKDIKQK